MADVLRHLTTDNIDRVLDKWSARSVLDVRNVEPYIMDTPYATRFRLTLKSQTEYIVADAYKGDIHPAHASARKSLVRHLYGPQLELGYKALDAVYGGASREDVSKILGELLESMTE